MTANAHKENKENNTRKDKIDNKILEVEKEIENLLMSYPYILINMFYLIIFVNILHSLCSL